MNNKKYWKVKDYGRVKNLNELEKYLSNYLLNNVDRLYHFTTYESLIKIIKNRTFMLTKIGKSNDKAETFFAGDVPLYSMSYKEDAIESVNMWYMYGNPSGIKIRIDFPKEELIKCLKNNNWIYNNDSYVDPGALGGLKPQYAIQNVLYLENDKQKNGKIKYKLGLYRKPFNSLNIKSLNNLRTMRYAGFVKYDIWEAEREIRLRVWPIALNLNEDKVPDRIFLYITLDLIKSLHITFNPWMSNELKEEIRKSINGLCDGFELSFSDSDHNGEIDEMKY